MNIRDEADVPVAFVIGVARSGTTLLARMLGAHPDIVAGPETHLFNRGVNTLFDNFDITAAERAERIGLSQYVERDELSCLVRSFCDATLDAYRRKTKPGASVIVEKTPFAARGAEDELTRKLECYPDAHYIHIVRDPRAVVRSLENAWFGSFDRREATELWAESVSAVREVAPTVKRFMEVRYEHLVAEPVAVITDVFEWLGVSTSSNAMERVLDATKYRYVSKEAPAVDSEDRWQSELTPAEVAAIEAIAGPMMASLGYETMAPGPARISEPSSRVSTDTIVPAVRRVAGGIRRAVRRPRDLWSSGSGTLGRALRDLDEAALADLVDDHATFRLLPERPGPSPTGDAARDAFVEAARHTFAGRFEIEQWSAVDSRGKSALWFTGTRPDGQRVYVSLLVAWKKGRAIRIAWLERTDEPAAT